MRAVVLRDGALSVRETDGPVPLDPLPSVGRVIGLDDVPSALDEVRHSQGPPRIVVHPNG